MRFWAAVFLLVLCRLSGEVYYEGTATCRGYGSVDLSWMRQFLPYNPVIVEVGAYCGDQTVYAAEVWPQHRRIVALEPNPRAYELLCRKIEAHGLDKVEAFNLAAAGYNGKALLYVCQGPYGNDPGYEHESSLLPPSKSMLLRYQGPKVEVPCVVLDDWCTENGIDDIDILRVELEGLELQALRRSPNILKKTKLLIVQSFFQPYRVDMTNYFHLKAFLAEAHFVPLAHWYYSADRGLAVYISQELFDAYFVRCLGLGLGGLAYP